MHDERDVMRKTGELGLRLLPFFSELHAELRALRPPLAIFTDMTSRWPDFRPLGMVNSYILIFPTLLPFLPSLHFAYAGLTRFDKLMETPLRKVKVKLTRKFATLIDVQSADR